MSDSAKRYVIVMAILTVTALVTFGAYSNKSDSGAIYTERIPVIVGNWYGKDIPMDERTYDVLETRDALMREYRNPNNERVLLTVVFAQDNRKVAHPPEVCFAGSGWERSERDVQMIAVGDRELGLNRLILENGGEKQVVFYVYKAGGRLTHNYYVQQVNIVLNGMLRKKTSSALIRISSLVDRYSVEQTLERTERFTAQILPVLEQHLP